jgi:hypothetical protein
MFLCAECCHFQQPASANSDCGIRGIAQSSFSVLRLPISVFGFDLGKFAFGPRPIAGTVAIEVASAFIADLNDLL